MWSKVRHFRASVATPEEEVEVFVLARGGSETCPGKSVRDRCGQSLVTWTAGLVDRNLTWSSGDPVVNLVRSRRPSLT